MARIKIEDLPQDREMSDAELDLVTGGILIGLTPAPTLGRTPTYSIKQTPLPGPTFMPECRG